MRPGAGPRKGFFRPMSSAFPFHEIGRLPGPDDNMAIATRRMAAGSQVRFEDATLTLDYTVLEGHRFAVRPVSAGQPLLSWGLPFGCALSNIAPGNYACNALMIEALEQRDLPFDLPKEPNFEERITTYRFDERDFRPGEQVPLHSEKRYFKGYRRSPSRGVGTRNYIVILGTTSRTGSYAKLLEERLKETPATYPNIDGIAALAHTEGSGDDPLNNREILLRTLAGLIVHPNVGALLAVDYGSEQITNQILLHYMEEHHYPLHEVLHQSLTLQRGFQAGLQQGEVIVKGWLEEVNSTPRTEESLQHLTIGLQCGGSDAFSGVSGNPLAASVAKEIIRYGGSANLGETDELIGAESYLLENVRDLDTAHEFLSWMKRFKEVMSWHGVNPEGNPSGGNRFRGLYNIILKSIGAARKRDPKVRLDYVVDYAEQMLKPGYYFMHTPGHDLESVCGQVAGGSNLIFFVTGNGSVTNFPFVPTIKFVTTTRRHKLLEREMDVNAGAYLDGASMDVLTEQTLELTVEVASERRSLGEKAGHTQISIWRNWRQTDDSRLEDLLAAPEPAGRPVSIRTGYEMDTDAHFEAFRSESGYTADQVGLIMPTSLCSSQIARMSAMRLNQNGPGLGDGLSRYAALVHTEGCAIDGRSTKELYYRTVLNYMAHPMVRYGLFLEHGCEKTHNDFFRWQLRQRGKDLGRYGWASVQLDGGIEKVLAKIENWFRSVLSGAEQPVQASVGLDCLRLGLLALEPLPTELARTFARLTRTVVGRGGIVVTPHWSALMSSDAYLDGTVNTRSIAPSLGYGQYAREPGFYVMEAPSRHVVETLTGLGATGVEVILAHAGREPLQSHPMIPTLQVTAEETQPLGATEDFDLILEGEPSPWPEQLLGLVLDVASRRYTPRLFAQGNVDFQITRGLIGISI